MRLRHVVSLAFLAAACALASSCKTAGVRYVVMSIDAEGKQPRSQFFTDQTQIACVAMYSGARPDATLDFVVRAIKSIDWQTQNVQNDGPYAVFSAGEITPSTGAEQAVGYVIPASGVIEEVQCLGQCLQNPLDPTFDPCPAGYTNQGKDSCGIGATCCFDPAAQPAQPTQQTVPFPWGQYECDVYLDGELQGTAPFVISYPKANGAGQSCPAIPTVSGVDCVGWVPPNSKCIGVGPGYCCVCDPNEGIWDCADTHNASCQCGTPGCP